MMQKPVQHRPVPFSASSSVVSASPIERKTFARQTLYGLAKRHDVQRQLIRVWVRKYEEGAFDDDAQAADLIQEYEAESLPWSGSSASRLWNWSF